MDPDLLSARAESVSTGPATPEPLEPELIADQMPADTTTGAEHDHWPVEATAEPEQDRLLPQATEEAEQDQSSGEATAKAEQGGEGEPNGEGEGKKPKGIVRNLVELVGTVAAAIVLALLVQAFLFKPYTIPSGSMEPTLTIGQRIIVNRLDTDPGLGNVVVFHPSALACPEDGNCPTNECLNPRQGLDVNANSGQACDVADPRASSQTFVKRVVGLPGDHLRIVDGYVYRNGKKETGSFVNLSSCSPGNAAQECSLPKTIVVPKGDYYMMGDNRGNSDDSRYWGPVPQRNIIGVAIITYWPIDRIGFF